MLSTMDRDTEVKCRTERPKEYPERIIPEGCTSFMDLSYQPMIYLDPNIYGTLDSPIPKNSRKAWARDLPETKEEIIDYLASLEKNPGGPTGLIGPGKLGKPKNWAADPVVMSVNPDTGDIYQVQIQRDSGQWAIPGGMVDDGENSLSTSIREFMEETGVDISNLASIPLYIGYCDDSRNTDTHYMMSTVSLYYVPWGIFQNFQYQCQDLSENIKSIKPVWLNAQNVNELFASHPEFVKLALIQLGLNANTYGLDGLTTRTVLKNISEILELA
jgi:8-oxo-dGTP pyrophosphatase MutT (NUDIX family)